MGWFGPGKAVRAAAPASPRHRSQPCAEMSAPGSPPHRSQSSTHGGPLAVVLFSQEELSPANTPDKRPKVVDDDWGLSYAQVGGARNDGTCTDEPAVAVGKGKDQGKGQPVVLSTNEVIHVANHLDIVEDAALGMYDSLSQLLRTGVPENDEDPRGSDNHIQDETSSTFSGLGRVLTATSAIRRVLGIPEP